MGNEKAVLKVEQISKKFGPVQALKDVSFDLKKQEILGLIGDNAAGKSTLLKIIAGVYSADEGKIYINGERTKIESPLDAQQKGIEIVYQDFMLAPNLDASANVFLGREITSNWGLFKRVQRSRMRWEVEKTIQHLGFKIDLHKLIGELSGGQQQTVAIARALHFQCQIILMDEPTAALSMSAIKDFQPQVRKVRDKGASIIYVSHRLPEVIDICDRIVILRRGETAKIVRSSEITVEDLVEIMVGAL